MKYILLILSISLFSSSFAQSLTKAYEYIDQKEYDKALKLFVKALEKQQEPVAAKFGMAKIYLSDEYPEKSDLRAFKNLRYVLKKLDGKADAEQLEKNYGITKKHVSEMLNQAAQSAYERTILGKEDADLDKFINIYEEADITQKVINIRDSIEYSKAKETERMRDYQSFALNFPDSKFTPEATKIYQALWKAEFDSVIAIGDYTNLRNFETRYPEYPFYNDTTKAQREIIRNGAILYSRKSRGGNVRPELPAYIPQAAFSEIGYLALIWLIEPKISEQNYAQAADTVRKYLPYFSDKSKQEKLLDILTEATESVIKNSISPNINTDAMEYAPCLTASGKTLYLCGRDRENNLSANNEDVFMSTKTKTGWTKPEPVRSLNTAGEHEAPLAVSADGNRMLLYTNSDIYYTDKTETAWKPIRRFDAVNETDSWEADAMLTADGNAILFISDRAENIGPHVAFPEDFHGRSSGSLDIYISVKQGDYWLPPVNLGSTVNTPFTERSPFLHPDMKTLYFSSDGHAGLGGLDVFMTQRLSDTSWTEWSEPINLGRSINTSADEHDYKISSDGKSALYAYKADDNFDIMEVEIPAQFRPKTVSSISGTVTNTDGKKLQAELVWEDLETGEICGSLGSDPITGEYIIVLPNGKNYGFFVSKEGYYPLSGNIDLRKVNENQNIEQDFVKQSDAEILSGAVGIKLQNVFFETAEYTLKSESFPELNRLADFLNKHPELQIEISGHTDNQGTPAANLTLSKNRAESVKAYLISKKCDESKLSAKGYGQTQPKTANSTAEGRAENRRVEFRVVK